MSGVSEQDNPCTATIVILLTPNRWQTSLYCRVCSSYDYATVITKCGYQCANRKFYVDFLFYYEITLSCPYFCSSAALFHIENPSYDFVLNMSPRTYILCYFTLYIQWVWRSAVHIQEAFKTCVLSTHGEFIRSGFCSVL